MISEGKGNSIYLNPGIKLGYQFGEGGGFDYGLEVSLSSYDISIAPLTGIFLNIDKSKKNIKIHLGVQSSLMLGVSLGPTILIKDNQSFFGITSTLFGFIFVMPYYEYTYLFGTNNIHQLGVFGKVPIPLKYGDNVYNIWD